jgi:Arc/MetJ-type ribon-helix-helix transcriptional regulator
MSKKIGKKSNKKVRKELKIKGANSIIRDILTIYSNMMFKTQLYLPNKANEMLDKLAKKIGSSKSELVRKAVDEFLQKYDKTKLKEAYGIWKDYEIDLRGMRDDWKR